jgi:hypothetical protein
MEGKWIKMRCKHTEPKNTKQAKETNLELGTAGVCVLETKVKNEPGYVDSRD